MQAEFLDLRPEARREELITKELDGELLVYDRKRDRAHCLNQSAASIWQMCDGRKTLTELAHEMIRLSANGLSPEAAEEVVCFTLAELRRSHLLEEPKDDKPWPQTFLGMPRRDAIRRIGLGAAITLPLIISLTVPTAVEAAVSCKKPNVPCGSPPECCTSCDTTGTGKCI